MGPRNGAATSGNGRSGAPPIAEALASKVLQDVPVLTDRLVREITLQNPAYDVPSVVPYQDLWRSCHDNLTRVLQLLTIEDGGEGTQAPEEVYDAARHTGVRRAKQGMRLEDVLRSFRLGGRLVWEALIAEARAQGVGEGATMLDLGDRMWNAVDKASAEVATAYQATERDILRAEEQRRAALWDGLLAGRAKDPTFAAEVARSVGVPVEGRYAVVATSHGDQHEVTQRIGDRLSALGVETAWQPRPEGLVGLLALRECPLQRVVRVLGDRLEVAAGVSLVVPALAEADTAHAQARLALRTVDPGSGVVVPLDDRLPEALLLDRTDLAERLVENWLGALLDLPAADRKPLLDTLEMWVESAGSTTRTAELLPVHRNTVINRMRRIHAVTGHDLSSGHVPLEMALALRAHRLLTHT